MPPVLTRILIAAAALLIAAATSLGAVASHLLAPALAPDALHAFETAVDYQFIHSLGLMGIAIYGRGIGPSKLYAAAALTLLAGTVLFCGGVYASSLGGPGWLAHLAPAGGIALIAAWLAIAVAVLVGGGKP